MTPETSDLHKALARLATAEINQYNCEQERIAAHQEVGRQLRRVREAMGMSLRKIADQLGYSAAFVSDCELGRRRLSPEAVNKYRAAIAQAKGEAP